MGKDANEVGVKKEIAFKAIEVLANLKQLEILISSYERERVSSIIPIKGSSPPFDEKEFVSVIRKQIELADEISKYYRP